MAEAKLFEIHLLGTEEVSMSMAFQNIWSKHKLLVSVIIIAVVVIVGALIQTGRSSKTAQAAPQPLEVEVARVEQRDVPIYSEWIGTTEGMVNAEIKAQVTGYLLRQDYKEGAFVKKGELLFEIDPRPLQAALDQASGQVSQFQGQLEQAKSQVTQAEAQVAQADSQLAQTQAQLAQAQANQVKAQLDVNKYGPLAEQKAVTQQDYDNAVQVNVVAKAQVEAAKAGVEAARAQLRAGTAQIGTAKAAITTSAGQLENAKAAVRTAQLNLGFTRIVSPIDGIAGIAQAQVGNLVSTTSNPLTTVSTLDPMKYNKANLNDGQQGPNLARLELELILSDGSSYPQKGTFYFADRQIDQKTGAIRVAGIFPNPGNVLRPGQYGRVRAVTSTEEGALLVPQRAVTELQGSFQVAVVGSDNKVQIRTVKVGERVDTMWLIEDGLKPGETVVVGGTQKAGPGALIKPKPYASSATEKNR
jgi:membrane fusion protein, multidrug efflux system